MCFTVSGNRDSGSDTGQHPAYAKATPENGRGIFVTPVTKQWSIAVLAFCAGTAWAQDKVVLGGAGSMISVTQGLVQAFQDRNPGAQIEVVPTTMGSTGGINALATGKLAVALSARGLRPEEQATLVSRKLGRTAVVFAVNRDVNVKGLTEAQACDLFAGKITSWRQAGGSTDQKVAVLTRNEDDGSKEAVRKQIACFKDLKEAPDATVLIRSSAMVSRLGTQPGAIGITETDAVADSKGAFQDLALDGVRATPQNVRSGKYRVVKEFAFVTKGEPQGLAKRFLDFATSPDAAKIMDANGIVTAN